MEQKIIFFDIDGTLVIEKEQIIPESTINALKKAKENGHLLFVNTGRPFCGLSKDLYSLNFDGYICGSGTHIYLGEDILYEKNIEKDRCFEIVEKLRECKIPAILEGKNSVYLDNQRTLIKELVEMKEAFEGNGIDIVKTWDDENLDFSKLLIWINPESEEKEFFNFIRNDFNFIKLKENVFEVFQKGHTKATGIKRIQSHLTFDLNNCITIGDSNNDLSMFEYVPNSILMGNGDTTLSNKVSFITKRVEDNGIEHALKHFEII